jgi:hypothetical protein
MSTPVRSIAPSEHGPDVAGYLVGGAIGIAVLFVASVYAPQRVKLPGLSPLALGALAGWGLGRWAVARQVHSPTLVLISAWSLIAAGTIGAAVETYRTGVAPIRDEMNRLALEKGPLVDRIEEAMSESALDDATREKYRADHEQARQRRAQVVEQQQRLLTFFGYLENRVPPQWGRWPPPWPELFFVAETLLAATIGALVARRRTLPPGRERSQPPESSREF